MQEFTDQMPSDIRRYPMVPIRDVVIFPSTKVAFKIGRPSSVRALEEAMTGDRDIFLATQHDATIDEPSAAIAYSTQTAESPRKVRIASVSATSVAKTIINAIATYSSMLPPQNAHYRGYLCFLAHVAQYIIRDFNRLEKVPLFTKVALFIA